MFSHTQFGEHPRQLPAPVAPWTVPCWPQETHRLETKCLGMLEEEGAQWSGMKDLLEAEGMQLVSSYR